MKKFGIVASSNFVHSMFCVLCINHKLNQLARPATFPLSGSHSSPAPSAVDCTCKVQEVKL